MLCIDGEAWFCILCAWRHHRNNPDKCCLASDFILAFEAGRIIEAVHLSGAGANEGEDGTGTASEQELPTVVIVTKDAGLEVVKDELLRHGVPCTMISNVAQLGEMIRAMSILDSSPGRDP